MEPVGYRQVEVTGGFWGEMQRLNAEVSVYNIHKRFSETGRFSALKCQKSENKPHIFYDSDVAKWLESAAYILAKKEDAHLRALAEEAIGDICRSQQPCGYFNSYFQVCEPENIFQKRTEHELYCAGHLIEAAVALKEAGVDEKLYAAMCRYADYIYDRFYKVDEYIQGAGLGLSIVQTLIKLLQGKITVTSKENEGTRFEVTLPKQMAG